MNLAEIIEPHPSDAVALVSRGAPTPYGALREEVAALRGGLASLGIGADDRVAILCANNPTFVVSYLAVLGLGAVVVPLNPLSPAPELEREVAAVDILAVIVGPAGRASWAEVDSAKVPSVRAVIATAGHSFANAVTFEDLLAASPVPIVGRESNDLAALLFTSGTAGSAKAAMLTHGNLLSNLRQIQQQPGRGLRADDVVLGVLPLFHIFGMNVVLGLALYAGASVVLVERFDPATALETIETRGVTVIAGAPPMWTAWATLPQVSSSAFSSVRVASTGASKMPEDLSRLFQSRFHLELLEGYGLTEASPVVTASPPGESRVGSIGLPLSGLTVRLVDHDGDDALEGDAGEVWVKGPNVFAGYWHDDEATARALTNDGWLRTGDVAVADDEGYLYLVDRAKDLIIVSGFNVYPGEVEDVIAEYPGVEEVAVVGSPHPSTGEAVKAFVVPAPGTSMDEEAIIDHCRRSLARYKCPTKVMFVDELPKGWGGKVLRRVLR
ncbi:MAG TPA: AMP-binding protein [Acidimicrobiales bacterium]|nr:AMP-binding protein [Acidimicrobiales bacterium]